MHTQRRLKYEINAFGFETLLYLEKTQYVKDKIV